MVRLRINLCNNAVLVWVRKKRDIDELLHQAIVEDDPEYLRRLLKGGASPEAVNRFGYTALEMARLLGRLACEQLLEPRKEFSFLFQGPDDESIECYSGQQFKEKTGVTFLPHLQFESYSAFKNVVKQCPWILRRSFFGRQNRWLAAYYHEELQSGYVAETAIRWIDETMGYGLFAHKDIRAESYIGQYAGIERRRYRFNPNQNDYCMHYPTGMCLFRPFMVDSATYGNHTRFLNHSDTPNLEPICLIDRGILHFAFRSLHNFRRAPNSPSITGKSIGASATSDSFYNPCPCPEKNNNPGRHRGRGLILKNLIQPDKLFP